MKIMQGTLIALIFTLTSSALAVGGITVGNGGDTVAQEFMGIGQDLAASIPYLKPGALREDQQKKFVEAVGKTKVISKESLKLGSVAVDAINYPDKGLIEVSRSRWNQKYADVAKSHKTLVLHEYLWMAGIDDTDYKISNPLYPLIVKAEADKAADQGSMSCFVVVYNAEDILSETEDQKKLIAEWRAKLSPSDIMHPTNITVNGHEVTGTVWQQGGADVYQMTIGVGAPYYAVVDNMLLNDGPSKAWESLKGTAYRYNEMNRQTETYSRLFLSAIKKAGLWKDNPYEGVSSGDSNELLKKDVKQLLDAGTIKNTDVVLFGLGPHCTLVK